MAEDFKVTPWEVTGDIDYDVLMKKFGTTPIDKELMDRISRYGEPHYMMRRGIFYCHRDLGMLLDDYDKGNKFYLYTGRGPSGNTHLGHVMPWIFNKWVQDTFKVDMLFQMQIPKAAAPYTIVRSARTACSGENTGCMC